jgi:hypothetical protein
MRVRASSASALMVSLLANDVLAAVHGRHERLHRKRTEVTVTDDVVETKTEIIYVTVDWPGGETIGVQYPTDLPPPADSTTTTASPSGESVTDTFAPAATSSTSSVAPSVAPAAVHASSSTSVEAAQFIQATSTPAAVPTTMATVVKPANTPAATAAAAAASTPASSSSGTGIGSTTTDSSKKRGLAYNTASLTQYFAGGNSKVSWAYNWGQTSAGSVNGLEYVPMLWSNDPQRVQSWKANADAAIAAGSTHLFSFNEPDLNTQANMPVSDAVSAYKDNMEQFAGKAKLGAPAVTNGGAPMGLTYLSDFISSCTTCTIDFVNIHWYDSATNFAYFKKHVEDAYKAGGNRPVWISEFAASGSEAEQNAFLEVVIPWLDAQPYVERYAYFMCKDGVLVSGNSVSSLGSTFMSYASSTISSLIASV